MSERSESNGGEGIRTLSQKTITSSKNKDLQNPEKVRMDAGMDAGIQTDQELKLVNDEWATLPGHIKAAIMALVQTAGGK